VQARKELGERGFVQLRGAWFGNLDEPGPNEVALDSHTVLDVAAGWRFAKGLELNALVRNLLDETYLLTPDARSPLAPGTSALLTARFAF
jgi:outer membrane receptor protein involved in Fe transport